MRMWMPAMVFFAGLMACGERDFEAVDSGSTTTVGDSGLPPVAVPPEPEACSIAEEAGCLACYDGEMTCSYGDESVTVASCGDCQARVALYAELCGAGIADSLEEIEAGMVCSDPV